MLYWQGKGRYQKEYDQLWERLVPPSDEATSIQGELVRSIGRLTSEYYRNGNCNWGWFYFHFTTFLRKHLRDRRLFDETTIEQIEDDIAMMRHFGRTGDYQLDDGEDAYDRITDRVVEWCRARPQLRWLDKSAATTQPLPSIADVFQE